MALIVPDRRLDGNSPGMESDKKGAHGRAVRPRRKPSLFLFQTVGLDEAVAAVAAAVDNAHHILHIAEDEEVVVQ